MGIKTRIVPVLLWDEHGCVKGKQFNPGRRIGSMTDRIRLLERRGIDELIILDIAATPNNRSPRFEEVTRLCENLFMPVTVGGGIRNISDVGRLLAGGADKVAICTAAIERPEFIDEAARKFGSQAVVVAIDALNDTTTSHCAKRAYKKTPRESAIQAERCGAGEILLTSIDRDGMMEGYDLDLIREVSDAVPIPVIAAGGAGTYEHMVEAMKAGAHAVAVGAAFQFREMTPRGAAVHLTEHGFQARL